MSEWDDGMDMIDQLREDARVMSEMQRAMTALLARSERAEANERIQAESFAGVLARATRAEEALQRLKDEVKVGWERSAAMGVKLYRAEARATQAEAAQANANGALATANDYLEEYVARATQAEEALREIERQAANEGMDRIVKVVRATLALTPTPSPEEES